MALLGSERTRRFWNPRCTELGYWRLWGRSRPNRWLGWWSLLPTTRSLTMEWKSRTPVVGCWPKTGSLSPMPSLMPLTLEILFGLLSISLYLRVLRVLFVPFLFLFCFEILLMSWRGRNCCDFRCLWLVRKV